VLAIVRTIDALGSPGKFNRRELPYPGIRGWRHPTTVEACPANLRDLQRIGDTVGLRIPCDEVDQNG
jgi:hypothetical protein